MREVLVLSEDAEAVVIIGENVIGFVMEQGYGFAKVHFTDSFGIEHEEYLLDEEYIPLEEWTKE